MSSWTLSRRGFLQGAAAAAAPLVLGSRLRAAPSTQRTLGFIGMGTMNRGHLGWFLGQSDVHVLAVCDVEPARREHARATVDERYAEQIKSGRYQGCAAYNDFRELVGRDDIDAVVIATPDHWHATMALAAMLSGKDVYCEKPLTHSIAEGRKLADVAAQRGTVFQTGSQQRSEFGGRFRTAVEYIRNGRLGKVKTVRIGVGSPPVVCDLPAQPVPEGTDWDLWLGPAPVREYNEILCPKGVHGHFPAWRNYLEYAGGGVADMGAHHFDIAQWALAMDASGPVKIEPPADGAKVGLKLTYANGVEMYHGGPSGCTFEGELGVIYVDRGELRSDPATILAEPLGEDAFRAPPSDNHRRNWLDAIASRSAPICTAEIGHRTATVCHLTNLGYRLGRTLHWDPAAEAFENDDEANALRSREPRQPWTLG